MDDVTRFLVRGLLFALVCLSPILIEAVFPNGYFSRSTEVYFKPLSDRYGFYYSDLHAEMNEVGDLGIGTQYSLQRRVVWDTDDYGQRNAPSSNQMYDIVLIGDSDTAGHQLTQNQTLAVRLAARTGLRTYAFAAFSEPNLQAYLADSRFLTNPPKVVVLENIERCLNRLRPLQNVTVKDARIGVLGRIQEMVDRRLKGTLITYAFGLIKQRILPNRSALIDKPSGVMFLQDSIDARALNQDAFGNISDMIQSYNRYFEARGIRFIFMPVPDKETIYNACVPGAPPLTGFLENLTTTLRARGITVADLHSVSTLCPQSLFFEKDDTHWNENGADMAAAVLAGMIMNKDVAIGCPPSELMCGSGQNI